MSTSMLYKNGSMDPSKPNSQSNLHLNQQRSHGSSSNRPSSAGATRSRSGVYGYNRGSQGNTNLYGHSNQGAAGIYGQSYGNQRPSSAGHSRPTSAAAASAANAANIYTNALNINQMHISAPSNPVPNVQPTSSSSSRPRSAGAIRRPYDATSQTAAAGYSLGAQYGTSTQARATATPMYDQQYNPFTNTLSGAPSSHQRPLSANATSHTNGHTQQYTANYISDQWNNTAYKLQYGNNVSRHTVQTNNSGATASNNNSSHNNTAAINSGGSEKLRPSSSNPANKLRQALDLSHKLDPQQQEIGGGNPSDLPIRELTGIDNDGDGEGLDDFVLGVEGVDPQGHHNAANNNAGDEEMDGKPVQDSRSHPEVSMTTPSASVELANNSSLHGNSNHGVDVRNTSLDSFSEDNVQVGLTTVPNQFCTKRDALELRKLLVLSAGTRGGIVPSSSAVMDMYMVGKVVGVGSYGKVRAAWHRLTGSKIAIKTYDKAKLKDPAHWKRVHSEIKIMEQISHPRIARMYEAVETPKRMHLIMECLDGGNLCSYVKAKRRLSEDESRRIFFQILQAVEYLHSLGVSHRDIKLENVLFVNDRDIKLIDFGFSTVCQPGKKLKVFCGTPSYMAPEIVRRVEYEGKPVDIWSLGILLYALLCGCFPFRAKAYPDLYRRIARGTFQIPEELSAPVKDLLRLLLTVDPEQRITAHTALRHSWLQVQYVNAPNMDKLRQEITFLISEKPADDLDEQVISELTAFGMSRDEIIRLVLTKTHSSLATLYYLLLDVVVARRRASGAGGGAKGKALVNHPTNTGSTGVISSKYVQQVRKTVNSSSGGANNGNGAVNNFPNAILNGSGGGAGGAAKMMPVTSGPITVGQMVNDAAHVAQQQQQMQYNYDYSSALHTDPNLIAGSSNGQRVRPSSASQTRAPPLNSYNTSATNNATTQMLLNSQQQTQPMIQPQQRPLSAYAGSRR